MPNPVQKSSQNIHQNFNYPGLPIISEFTKERVAEQLEQVNALDSKANFVLGSATAIFSAALVLEAVLLGAKLTTPTIQDKSTLALFVLLIVYLFVMLSAFMAYRVRSYQQAPDPTALYENYLSENEETIKAMVFRATLEAYESNVKKIKRKVRWFNIAFSLLGLETAILGIVLLLQISH